jgi:hypothetical protein
MGNKLTYSIIGETKMKKTLFAILLCLFAVSAWAQTGSLAVTVVDDETGFAVAAALVDARLEGHGHNLPHFDGITDENGVVFFPDIPVGEYEVNAGALGYRLEREDVDVTEGVTTELTLELEALPEWTPLRVEPGHLHFGPVDLGATIVRAVHLHNLSNVEIAASLAVTGDGFALVSAADVVVGPGPIGAVEILISLTASDLQDYIGTLTITTADDVIEVPLDGFGADIQTGALSVDVIVTDSLGVSTPVDSARVRLAFVRDHGGPRPHHVMGWTDANGHVEFPDVPVGLYNLNASKRGIGFASQPVEILAEQTTFATLTLLAADSSEHGNHGGHGGGGHHFEIVELSGTCITEVSDSGRVHYFLDVDADAVADYRLGFGPEDYQPEGLTRPNNGDAIAIIGGLMTHGEPPLVVVFILNGAEWRPMPNPAGGGDGYHGGDGGGRAEGYGCDSDLTWVELSGAVTEVTIYNRFVYLAIDNDNDNVSDYVIDFGDNYSPNSAIIPSVGDNVDVIGGLLGCTANQDNAPFWVVVYEVNAEFWREPGDTEGLTPITGSAVNPEPTPVPVTHLVAKNYPNPFNPTTTISFATPISGLVKVSVFDILGREVTTLVNENLTVGNYTATWNAVSMPSGMYLYRVSVNDQQITNRMLLLK